ncbi:hypothetical protein G3570_03285 [Balneolaceae bacterium YR4-1]|uniref:Uncharacterized protein n=1 Tax=Halalkalibaculum roseum TaxID=2709311 RepID=A0A6M1SKV9_9BACT|nr:hypothetical protein [Halalkalibaculum roseum]NGP75639.1 hypothetical protein [Halalkalibaculum roseum]
MKPVTNFKICLIAMTVLFSTSCEKSLTGSEPDLTITLKSVEEVQLISGGENTTITVNKNNNESNFSIYFSNIDANNVIENGTLEAWCIDWTKHIGSNNTTYQGIKLYSTDRVEKWEKVNYLLNIKDQLKNGDPNITWREFQVVIWSLRANPEFDLDKIEVEDLPSSMLTNGQPNFSYDKVKEILLILENGYKEFVFSAGTKFAVIAATPADVQTVFGVVEKK